MGEEGEKKKIKPPKKKRTILRFACLACLWLLAVNHVDSRIDMIHGVSYFTPRASQQDFDFILLPLQEASQERVGIRTYSL
jgi:hypothetical protein